MESVELLCNRLLSALFNGGYQGLLLAGLLWLGFKTVRRTNAATRHAVWFAALLIVAALPVVHFLVPARSTKQEAAPDRIARGNSEGFTTGAAELTRIPATIDAPGASWEHLVPLAPPVAAESISIADTMADQDRAEAMPAGPVTTTSAGTFELLEFASRYTWPPAVSSEERHDPHGSITEQPTQSKSDFARALPELASRWSMSLPDGTGPALVGLWLLLSAFRLARLLGELVGLSRFKRRAAAAPEHLRLPFVMLTTEMGVGRPTRLLLSPDRHAPMVVGFLNPAVMLPEKLVQGVPPAELQQVLRHELAHVGRGDDWATLIQQVIKSVLFFQPAVWWLCRRLTLEREVACDDHVLAASQLPRAYALFLTEFAGRMQSHRLEAAPAAWSNKSQLKERIAMILDSRRNASPRLAGARAGILTLSVALVATGALLAAPRLALAADEEDEEAQVQLELEADNAVSVSVDFDEPVAPELELSADAELSEPQVELTLSADGTSLVAFSGPRVKAPAVSAAPAPAAEPAAACSPVVPLTVVAPAAAPVPSVVSVTAHPVPMPAPAAEISLHVQPVPAARPPSAMSLARGPGGPKGLPPGGHGPKGSSDSSLEDRMERLERMVEELIEHQLGPRMELEKKVRMNSEVDRKQLEKMSSDLEKMAEKVAKAGLDEGEVAKIKDHVRREVEHAAREMERAKRDVQRAMQEHAIAAREQARAQHAQGGQREAREGGLHQQRKALEAERESLEHHLREVERRIDQIEEEQERADELNEESKRKPGKSPGAPGEAENDDAKPKRKPPTR